MVVFSGVQLLDVVGPCEAFSVADRLADRPRTLYRVEAVAAVPGAVTASSGLQLNVGRALTAPRRSAPDTVLVAGGMGVGDAAADRATIDGVRRLARRARRVGSVCSGAFVLAAAGLLDGRAATTHWASAGELARRFPDVHVEADRIFVRDGSVWSSAGVTAGIDLALAMIAEDHGAELARQVAKWLVVYLQRPGGQSQFSAHLTPVSPAAVGVRELQVWVGDHLDGDLSVIALARRAGMSERTFQRAFRAQTGVTPAQFVERLRVEHACRLLEAGALSIREIASRCGYANVETLYRAFARQQKGTPASYRSHFQSRPA